MEKIELKAEKREITGKQVKAWRRQGKLPAVMYGHHLAPIPIWLDLKEASHVLPNITKSQLISIKLGNETHTALVREKQRHPVQGSLLHVDLLAVSMTEKLRASVPFVGDAPAVKDFGGVVVTNLEEIEVECLPQDLPEKIIVDLAKLANIGDAIHVKNLDVPSKVEVLTEGEEIVVIVTPPAGEEVEGEAVEGAEPEVIEKGKKEEEEF